MPMMIEALGDLHQQRGGHRVGVVGGGFDRGVRGDRRDELALADLAAHQHEQAGEHEATADPQERAAAMSAGQEHRQAVQREHEDRQQQRQRMERFGQIAHEPKLARGDDLQVRHRRRAVFRRCPRAGPRRWLRSATIWCRFSETVPPWICTRESAAVDDRTSAWSAARLAFLPGALHLRRLPAPAAAPCSARPCSAPEIGPASGCSCLGRPDFSCALHVDVRVQLVDQIAGDGGADGRLLQQRRARLRPVGRVHELAVGPDREDRQDREQGGEHEDHAHPDAMSVRGR